MPTGGRSRRLETSWPSRGSLAAAAAALALAVATQRGVGSDLDRRAFSFVNRGRLGPRGDAVMRGVTELGSIAASIGAAVTLARAGRGRAAVDGLAAAGVMWWLGQVLKRRFRRLRPYEAQPELRLLIGRASGASWPSSHPAVLLVFCTVVARDLDLGPAARACLHALVAAVGLSRVHLGVHYPSDVIGGVLLARATADAWGRLVSPLVAPLPRTALAPAGR